MCKRSKEKESHSFQFSSIDFGPEENDLRYFKKKNPECMCYDKKEADQITTHFRRGNQKRGEGL